MNPKNLLSFILIMILCSLDAVAQTFQVGGSIVEGDTKQSLPQVSVQLLNGADSSRVATSMTDEKGRFTLKAKKEGEYIVMAKLMGFSPLVRNVKLTTKRPEAKLGEIAMRPAPTQMDEVSVSALARMMTVKDDTLVFNSAALRLPPNASLAAMMKELPGIGVDKDGNMTFQGKVVSNILVDGKPFFGNVGTALANMPTDAVQNVKIYEKTDEEKEFRGEVDTDKATVVDLTIKQEYKSKWIANANAGGGTDKRYIGKLFATNFTDRRRTAVYAQLNNISQNQQVDDNGNWYFWGGSIGLFDYRKVGANMQFDNGKSNKDGGNLRGNANIDVQHNNNSFVSENNHESFLGGGNTQYSYGHNENSNRDLGVNANAHLTYNIDKNNRLNLSARYSFNQNRGMGQGQSSVFHSQPAASDNLAGSLNADQIPDELKRLGVYSDRSNNNSQSWNHTAGLNASYTHLFQKEGRSFNINLNADANANDNQGNSLQMYRYFNPNAPQPELLKRQHSEGNSSAYGLWGDVAYAEPLTEHIKLGAAYNFSLNKGNRTSDLFDVNTIPHHLRPTPGDSLQYVSDLQNSFYSSTANFNQSAGVQLQGSWEKFEFSLSPKLNIVSERMDYDRAGELHQPSRTYTDCSMGASLRYHFTPQNYVQAYYNGNANHPSLMESLPIRDTSNPMHETVNNPNLKPGWNNSLFLSTQLFNPKRGDSYNISLGGGNQSNSVVTTEQVDPTTGYRRYGKMNVNGNYNLWANAYTDQPLDTMRHWNLNASAGISYSHNIGYVGSMGNSLGLSSINSFRPNAFVRMRYRKDIWSVSFSGMYNGDFSRYVQTPQYNQNAHTYELTLSPQVDLPFGMKINSQFIFYGRSGYADPLLNHPQWIINASISQSFLKSKALTIQLEGTDLLKSRTAENCSITPTSRHYNRTQAFLSYIMLHATYRFSI